MSNKENSIFAHRTTTEDINIFFDAMLNGKEITTEKEKMRCRASYLAMCILLPKDSFMSIVNSLGGLEKVKSNESIKKYLAYEFKVELKLIEARLISLMPEQEEKEKIYQKNKII